MPGQSVEWKCVLDDNCDEWLDEPGPLMWKTQEGT